MIKSRSLILGFCVVASVLFCIGTMAKAHDDVELRLHLHPGQTFDQGIAMEMKISKTSSKGHTDMSQVTHLKMHNQVLEVDNDGTIKMKMTFRAVAMKSSEVRDGKVRSNIEYDSAKPPQTTSPELKSTTALVGQSLILTVSPRGEVVKIDGVDAMVQRMATDIKSPDMRSFLIPVFERSVENMGRQMMGRINFAPEPVAIGDSWERPQTSPKSAPQLSFGEFTLMSIKDDIATIAVKSTSKPNPDAPLPGKNIRNIGALGTANGVIHVDAKTGLLRDFEIHSHSSGPIPPPAKSTSVKNKSASSWKLLKIETETVMRGWTVQLPQ